MAEEGESPPWVVDTQRSLGELIRRPKLTEALLMKPPFRFLHDIVTEVRKATGFAPDLYEEGLSDSAQVKEKSQKLKFLQLVMDTTGHQLGVPVEAKAAKIVAGLEADLTNKFLQMLALACQSGDSGRSVQRALAGEAIGSAPAAAAAPARAASPVPAPAQAPRAEAKADAPAARPDAKAPAPTAEEPMADPSMDAKDDEPQEAPKRMARPTTARRRPPKQADSTSVIADSKVAAKPVVGLMREGGAGDDEDSDGDEAIEAPDAELAAKFGALQSGPKGKLVQDIMSEMKEHDGEGGADAKGTGGAKAEGGIRLGKLKKSGSNTGASGFSEREIMVLRKSIQLLCQSTNPLGKCMDYVNDDMEMMSKELEKWKGEYRKRVETMEEESKGTEESLQPYQTQLAEVEEQCKEQKAKINGVKASIAKNEERIQHLLRMVVG